MTAPLKIALMIFVLALCQQSAFAAVKLPGVFSDHMVIQRDVPIKVWGTAKPAEKITVSFASQRVNCVANKHGNWNAILEEIQTGHTGELKIQGENTVVIKDVVAGDVFLCAGQTEFMPALKQLPATAAKHQPNSKLRIFVVPKRASAIPLGTLVGNWVPADKAVPADCSALSYRLGRDLQYNLKVPVGVIDCTFDDTPIAAWISKDRLMQVDSFKAILINPAAATTGGIGKPQPTSVYNGMIAPLIGYGVKTVCWYQGFSDLGFASSYRKLLPILIRDWRGRWAQEPELPFVFVQLPSSSFRPVKAPPNWWAEIRDAQASALALGSTTMVVTNDFADDSQLQAKSGLPSRLAAAIRHCLYEDKLAPVGPSFESYGNESSKIVLRFKHADKGLVLNHSKDNVSGFEIVDIKGRVFPAEAKVVESHVVVWSPQVVNPIEVRYDWKDAAHATLFNGEHLPAAPFKISIRL